LYSYHASSIATVRLDYYPFLADPAAIAERRYGLSLEELAKLRRDLVEAGRKRLVRAIRSGRLGDSVGSVEEEVFGFTYASVLAILSSNRWVVSRYALAEAERAYQLLQREPDENVAQIARLVGLKTAEYGRAYREPVALIRGVTVYREYPFSISLLEYVETAKRLLGDDSWKPANFPVLRGRIYLEKHHMLRLLKEAITRYVENRIVEIGKPLAEALNGLLAEHVEEIRKVLSEREKPRVVRGGRVEIPKGVIVEEAFPPCIRDLVERARRGENLSHHERFALATFLLNIGAEIEYVVDMFRNMPDFNEKITRYQVEHLAGLRGSRKRYRVYSCEKMKTLGICRADCENTRSPLQAYYRKLREFIRRKGLKGSQKPEETSGNGEQD
jgi:DNA primase large subunit